MSFELEMTIFRINKILYDMKELNCYREKNNLINEIGSNNQSIPLEFRRMNFTNIQSNIENLRRNINYLIIYNTTRTRNKNIQDKPYLIQLILDIKRGFNSLPKDHLKDDLRHFLRKLLPLMSFLTTEE